MVSKTMKKMNMTTKAGFDYGGIPPNLEKRGLFCLYRLELKTANAVKPDKVPYKQDGTRADPSNPADFCSLVRLWLHTTEVASMASVSGALLQSV